MEELMDVGRHGEFLLLSFYEQSKRDRLMIYEWRIHTVYDAEFQKCFNDDFFIVPEFFQDDAPSHVMMKINDQTIGAIGKYEGKFNLYNAEGRLMKSCLKTIRPKLYETIPNSSFTDQAPKNPYPKWDERKRVVFALASSGNIHLFGQDLSSTGLAANLSFYDPTFQRKDWLCVYDRVSHAYPIGDKDNQSIYVIYSGQILEQYPKDFDWSDYYWFLLGMIILSNVFD